MPFRLATAHATFMRLITIVFSAMLYNSCFEFLNYIIIFGRTFKKNLERLDKVFSRPKKASLKIKIFEMLIRKTQCIVT